MNCFFSRNLNWIYIELTEIKKTLEKAVIPAKKFRMELIEANKKLHENAWCIAMEVPDAAVKTATTTNSTSTTDLTKAFINGLNESLTSSFNAIYTELQEPQEPQHNSLNGKCTLTNSIIEDNINLRIRYTFKATNSSIFVRNCSNTSVKLQIKNWIFHDLWSKSGHSSQKI